MRKTCISTGNMICVISCSQAHIIIISGKIAIHSYIIISIILYSCSETCSIMGLHMYNDEMKKTLCFNLKPSQYFNLLHSLESYLAKQILI